MLLHRQGGSVRASGMLLMLLLLPGLSTSRLAYGDAVEASASGPAYVPTQARSGKKLYKQYCLSCHPKGYFHQVFRAWEGEPLKNLFGVMRADMPQNNPGGLDAAEYVDILAYILADSDYPAGSVALDPSTVAFQQIRISPPALKE